jgi:hypothetical protein
MRQTQIYRIRENALKLAPLLGLQIHLYDEDGFYHKVSLKSYFGTICIY